MSTESRQDLLAKVNPDRREFLRKIAIAAAFAAPTVATFSLDGMRKKAFAQAAYDPPRVIGVAYDDLAGNRVVVGFDRPMNTGVGDCRQVWFESGPVTHTVTWSGNMHQVIEWSNCLSTYLHITYNQPGCGGAKFVGVNGVELLPFSGMSDYINDDC